MPFSSAVQQHQLLIRDATSFIEVCCIYMHESYDIVRLTGEYVEHFRLSL